MNRNTLPVIWLLSVCKDVQCASMIYKAVKNYSDPEEFFRQTAADYDRTLFSGRDIERLSRKNTAYAEKIIENCIKSGIDIITYYDREYPEPLRNIDEPPAALFVKGNLPDFSREPSVSVIGTRKCSEFGRKFAASLAYALAHSGFTVVSGMAAGIDTYAHKGALLAAKRTVAVLPCGVDKVYPSQNAELYERIMQSGAVVSEYLPGTNCRPFHFRMRNRIISALSHSTVVVESAAKGGSMITVGHALQQGRTVFAVPGSPGVATSEGTNALLSMGALVCTGPHDIIDEYNASCGTDIKLNIPERRKAAPAINHCGSESPAEIGRNSENKKIYSQTESSKSKPKKPDGLSDTEGMVYDMLAEADVSVDDVCREAEIGFPEAVKILSSFELRGIAQALPGGFYTLYK